MGASNRTTLELKPTSATASDTLFVGRNWVMWDDSTFLINTTCAVVDTLEAEQTMYDATNQTWHVVNDGENFELSMTGWINTSADDNE